MPRANVLDVYQWGSSARFAVDGMHIRMDSEHYEQIFGNDADPVNTQANPAGQARHWRASGEYVDSLFRMRTYMDVKDMSCLLTSKTRLLR